MASQSIRIRLKSYEHGILDESAAKIVATAKRTGAEISGPVPLPTERVCSLFFVHHTRTKTHVNNLKCVRISV